MATVVFIFSLASTAFAQGAKAPPAPPPPVPAPTPATGATNTPAAPAGPEPRYLGAMRAELEAMQIQATCEATDNVRATCGWTARGRTSQQDFRVKAVYSDSSDTVYFFIEGFASAPADAASTPAVLRQLMELNWALLLGKLEWDPESGEVRLSMVINTDSNFDRRAFRSVARSIVAVGDRYWGDVQRTIRAAEAAP